MTGHADHYELFTRNGSADRDWMTRALCRIDGTPEQIRDRADQFFPHPTDRGARRKAQAICDNCPVKPQCDDHATKLDIPFGVWGGRHIDGSRHIGDRRPKCGTERGYHHHVELGEPLDQRCIDAARQAWKRRAQRRRDKQTGKDTNV